MRAFFGILGLAGAGFLVSSVSTVGCGSSNNGGSTGTAGTSGTGKGGTTGKGGSGYRRRRKNCQRRTHGGRWRRR